MFSFLKEIGGLLVSRLLDGGLRGSRLMVVFIFGRVLGRDVLLMFHSVVSFPLVMLYCFIVDSWVLYLFFLHLFLLNQC